MLFEVYHHFKILVHPKIQVGNTEKAIKSNIWQKRETKITYPSVVSMVPNVSSHEGSKWLALIKLGLSQDKAIH